MQFCDRHWTALHDAIEERGLDKYVPESGERAMVSAKDQLDREKVTAANFDPMLGAFAAISGNVMERVSQATGYLLADAPEDPVEGYGEKYEGRTWSKCPLCYLNLAHEVSCTGCSLPQIDGYDFFIEIAADEQAENAKELFGGGE